MFRLNPLLDLPTQEGWKAELTFVVSYIGLYRDGLPVRRQSFILVVTA